MFGTDEKTKSYKNTKFPGPGAYGSLVKNKNKSPRPVFGRDIRDFEKKPMAKEFEVNVGPGSYNSKCKSFSDDKNRTMYSFYGSKTEGKPCNRTIFPGPGEYVPQ